MLTKVLAMRFRTERDFDLFMVGKKATVNKSGSNRKKRSASLAVNVSSHAQALAQLAKNPDLANGNKEHYLQVTVFDYFERYHPEIYKFMSAYPAGGYRSKKAAAAMRAEGQARGYPDIILDMPKGIYHGARFELKTDVGTLQDTQVTMLRALSGQGYYCTARRGFDDMIKAILDYSKLSAGECLAHDKFDNKWLSD